MWSTEEEQSQAAFFDDCAARGELSELEPEHAEKARAFVREWDIRAGERVLEPGCGGGRLTALLADAVGPEGHVLALDLSEAMLALARARNLPPQAEFRRASAYALPCEDASMDKVLCFCVFPHFRRPLDFLSEARRVLKAGGLLWVNHLEGSESLNNFHKNAGEAVADHCLEGGDLMRELFQRAGFEVLLLEDCPESYRLYARKL